MKKALIIIGVIVSSLVLLGGVATAAVVAYGPASPLGITGETLAKQMQDTGWGVDSKDKLAGVSCLKKSARYYSCMGTYTMDKANVPTTVNEYGDTVHDEDAAKPHPISYEVIVGFDGMWIASPDV